MADDFLGCIEVIEPHLPTLIPYLLSMLNDTKVSIFHHTSLTLRLKATNSLLFVPLLAGHSAGMLAGARKVAQTSIGTSTSSPPWKA